ncbi:MAG: hypothetical protein ACRDE5_00720, partial [Ginsengibacter sp.]
ASIVCTFSSCTKQTTDCEVWEVTYGSPEGGTIGSCGIDLNCGDHRTLQLLFCGDRLKDAKAGNTIIINDDSCCTKTMTFNRFIKKN